MAEIVLGVTGGIAAYKAVDVLRLLQRSGHSVRVVMTRTAERFVGAPTFAALSGHPVGRSMFPTDDEPGYDHLDLARSADLLLIAPASANTLAKMAAGQADGLLGAVHLAFVGPVLVAPAMNTRMLEHPATVANLTTLEARGVEFVPPGTGLLADGEVGAGRLAEPSDIAAAVNARLGASRDLAGRHVLITAGGTREPIDAVRYVGNRSSGKMGWALAEAALARGATVTVLAANVELPPIPQATTISTPTAAQMRDEALAQIETADIVVMAAAVADYRPAEEIDGKLDKSDSQELSLRMTRTDDILSELGSVDGRRVLVGFAAEHGPQGIERAREKRERKGADLIVFNDVSVAGSGFGSDDNQITLIGADGESPLPRMPKAQCAEAILDAAGRLIDH
jgi:phosphopantothenoylcysteine decarboxylase/phosphopantothenate--cysteine ligase